MKHSAPCADASLSHPLWRLVLARQDPLGAVRVEELRCELRPQRARIQGIHGMAAGQGGLGTSGIRGFEKEDVVKNNISSYNSWL